MFYHQLLLAFLTMSASIFAAADDSNPQQGPKNVRDVTSLSRQSPVRAYPELSYRFHILFVGS